MGRWEAAHAAALTRLPDSPPWPQPAAVCAGCPITDECADLAELSSYTGIAAGRATATAAPTSPANDTQDSGGPHEHRHVYPGFIRLVDNSPRSPSCSSLTSTSTCYGPRRRRRHCRCRPEPAGQLLDSGEPARHRRPPSTARSSRAWSTPSTTFPPGRAPPAPDGDH